MSMVTDNYYPDYYAHYFQVHLDVHRGHRAGKKKDSTVLGASKVIPNPDDGRVRSCYVGNEAPFSMKNCELIPDTF